MKILYDYQIMLEQKYGGISRCFCELMARYKKMYSDKVGIIAIGSQNYYLEKVMGYKALNFSQWWYEPGVKEKFVKINQIIISRLCKKGYVDILHSTWYDSYLLDINNCKQIITIHDMIQEKVPEYKADRKLIKIKRQLMEKADKIVTVSVHTKKDILEIYPEIPDNKIAVVYNGGCIQKIPKKCSLKLPEKYILYVGARGNYKNFDNFIKAVKIIMQRYEDLSLVCVGGGTFTGRERNMLGDIRYRTMQINADDKDLAYLYRHAVEFVFPSKYEGFGIPVVEAFSCYCPVVLSNASCFPEIAKGAALYFDPDDAEDMAEKMERVIIDKTLRRQLIKKGYSRSKLFTWERNARRMHQIYHSTANIK